MEKANIELKKKNGEAVEISDAEVNGSCYIVDEAFTEDFDTIYSEIKIVKTVYKEVVIGGSEEDPETEWQKVGEYEENHADAKIIKPFSIDERFWFAIYDVPKDVIEKERLNGKVEYIAMMADVDLEV